MDSVPEITAQIYPAESIGSGPGFAINTDRFHDHECEEGENHALKILAYIRTQRDQTFGWMKSFRARFEQDWQEAENEYTLDGSRADDNNRGASILPLDPDKDTDTADEYDAQRPAIALPAGFEAVEQIIPRYYEPLFGSDPDSYVECLGRIGNDKARAEKVEQWLNYQQGWEIPTAQVAHDWIRDGIIYGTGIIFQYWDQANGKRVNECVSPWHIWFDPAARNIAECRWINLRKYITAGEALDLREKGAFAFTDEALEGVTGFTEKTGDVPQPETEIKNVKGDRTRQLTLDLWMEKDRWIYVINDTLIAAVVPNQVPPVKHADGTTLEETHPVHLFRPLPPITKRAGYRSVYGLSVLTLGMPMMDLANSIAYFMHANLGRQALGIYFIDPSAGAESINLRRPIEAGKAYPVTEPGKNVLPVQSPNITNTCIQGLDFLDSRLERLTGVNNVVRGTPSYATETATARQQDLSESAARLKMGILLGYQTMREFWSVALRLNQAFLEKGEYVRVVGEEAVWEPIQGEDLQGVAGKDLIPTGMPLSSSKNFLAQQGMNLVTVLQQLKVQGITDLEPRHLLRDIITSMGYRRVDETVPKPIQAGSDPEEENALLIKGIAPTVGQHDNHERHIQRHQAMYYDLQTREAMLEDAKLHDMIEAHILMHTEAIEGAPELRQAGGGGEGLGSGTGTPGLNTQLPAARPKPQAELAAQTGAVNG